MPAPARAVPLENRSESCPIPAAQLPSDWMLVDSHCHLDASDCGAASLEALLARASAARVERVVTVGVDLESSRGAVAIAERHEAVWAAVGVAPNDLDGYDDATLAALEQLAGHPKVVAIGEIGLDYHWHPETAARQKRVFAEQLALAREVGRPVIIHSREAEDDTRALLLPWAASRPLPSPPYGVLHCFSSELALAQEYVHAGFLISISGVVTFPRAHRLHAVARELDLEALALETDAPYLAPQAHRGGRNEPAFLLETARHVAALRGVELPVLARATSDNCRRLFRWSAVKVGEETLFAEASR